MRMERWRWSFWKGNLSFNSLFFGMFFLYTVYMLIFRCVCVYIYICFVFFSTPPPNHMKFNEIHMFIVWLRTVDFREPGNWVFNHPWCWVSHRHLAKGVSRKSKDLPTYPKGTYPKDPQLEQFMKESDWEFLNQSVFFFLVGGCLGWFASDVPYVAGSLR